MMVANSSNLIITVKPANQRTMTQAAPRRGSFSRNSAMSSGSHQSATSDDYEQDEIRDLTSASGGGVVGGGEVAGADSPHSHPHSHPQASKDEGVLHL